jgi:hypothetical protein
MIQPIWPYMSLGSLIHWVGLAAQGLARLAMWIGFFIIGMIAMPPVIALNLLTKFLAAIADRDR